jgi:hypothetical protein
MVPGGPRHLRGRIALLVGAAAMVTGVLLTQTQGARHVLPPTGSSAAHSLSIGQVRSAPAHWVTTEGPHVSQAAQSTNWSGYVDAGSPFTAISGTWVVPTVQPSAATLASGIWIGIDGATNSSLIQTGTAQLSEGGKTGYYDWYDLLPAQPVNLVSVAPGDKMRASIVETSAGRWTIAINDVTSGKTNSVAVT